MCNSAYIMGAKNEWCKISETYVTCFSPKFIIKIILIKHLGLILPHLRQKTFLSTFLQAVWMVQLSPAWREQAPVPAPAAHSFPQAAQARWAALRRRRPLRSVPASVPRPEASLGRWKRRAALAVPQPSGFTAPQCLTSSAFEPAVASILFFLKLF